MATRIIPASSLRGYIKTARANKLDVQSGHELCRIRDTAGNTVLSAIRHPSGRWITTFTESDECKWPGLERDDRANERRAEQRMQDAYEGTTD